jgi:hypothetical protein
MEQRITELEGQLHNWLVENGRGGWIDNLRIHAEAMDIRAKELEAQLAESKSIALDAQSESAAYEAMQERAQGDNATLQEEIFRLAHNQQLQDSTTAAVMERAGKAEGENAALREDAERYRWFRSKRLWDADQFPWPKDFEYPEPCLWDEGEMLDAAIDAARKT